MNFSKLKPSKATIYFLSLVGTVLMIFFFVIFMSINKETKNQETQIPQASGSTLSQILGLSAKTPPPQPIPTQAVELSEYGPMKPSLTPSPTDRPSPTPSPTPTATPTQTPSPTINSSTPTSSPSPTPTETAIPTASASAAPSSSP